MLKDNDRSIMRATAAVAASAAIAAGVWISHARAQPASSPGPFTEAQAQAGQAAYAQNCARCHDSGEAPPLTGAGFLNVWGTRTTRDLFSRIKDTMPVDNPGVLSNDTVVSIAAFLLKGNGAAAGTAAFTPTTAVAINTITTAEAPQAPQAGAGRRGRNAANGADTASASGGASADAELRRGVVPFRIGITVQGTVAKYTPITDEMMAHPPAADWLMHYWNYAGWSHSPLKQINAKN
ncbi:MAG TPA: c-type cytochrome, partial [Rhizomicrobium sp.]|nr:c-type cytochrome [Rhizomicrobium sp.]